MSPLLKKILIAGTPILLRKLLHGNNVFRKTGLILFLLIVGVWFFTQFPVNLNEHHSEQVVGTDTNDVRLPSIEQSDIRSLFDAQRSGVMVSTIGNVTRILNDDNKGSRHQRFLIEIPDGLSLLVAHNIDFASRVPLMVGDQVSIYGQYEWNHKGGVLHWTHHDPNKRHEEGWILHQGVKYE